MIIICGLVLNLIVKVIEHIKLTNVLILNIADRKNFYLVT